MPTQNPDPLTGVSDVVMLVMTSKHTPSNADLIAACQRQDRLPHGRAQAGQGRQVCHHGRPVGFGQSRQGVGQGRDVEGNRAIRCAARCASGAGFVSPAVIVTFNMRCQPSNLNVEGSSPFARLATPVDFD